MGQSSGRASWNSRDGWINGTGGRSGERKGNAIILLSCIFDGGKKRVAVLIYDRQNGKNELLRRERLDVSPGLVLERKLEEVVRGALAKGVNWGLLLKEMAQPVDYAVGETVKSDMVLAGESKKAKGGDWSLLVADKLLAGIEERVGVAGDGEGGLEDVRSRRGGGLRHGRSMDESCGAISRMPGL